jgi:hypothetical protein
MEFQDEFDKLPKKKNTWTIRISFFCPKSPQIKGHHSLYLLGLAGCLIYSPVYIFEIFP